MIAPATSGTANAGPFEQSALQDDWRDYCAILRCRLTRHLSRHGHRLLHGNAGVAVEEIAHTLGLAHSGQEPSLSALLPLPDRSAVERELASVERRMAARRYRCGQAGRDLPFETLRAAFQLGDLELELLAAQLASQTDFDLARLYRLASADFMQTQPTVGFLLELVSPTAGQRRRLLDALRPESPLRRYELIRLSDAGDWQGGCPLVQSVLTMPDRVAAFLQYGPERRPIRGPSGAWVIEALRRTDDDASLFVDDGFRESVQSVLAMRQRGSLQLMLTGPRGSHRRRLLRCLAAQQGRPLAVVDLARAVRAVGASGLIRLLAESLREAVLQHAMVLIQGADQLLGEGLPPHVREGVLDLLEAGCARLVLASDAPVPELRARLAGLVELAVPRPSEAMQRTVWTHALGGAGIGEPTAMATDLAQRYSLSPGQIERAVAQAVRLARQSPGAKRRRLAPMDLTTAVRSQMDHGLGELAEPMSTGLQWDDLIVSNALRAKLDAVRSRLRHRTIVMHDWGFGKRLDRGRGLSCLFSGPPGTGKTITAVLLGKELGREVYRVDLSRVVDKYIGETEKNLGRLFDEADRAQAVLLFDEADSLFAKRTKVDSSHDRYANLKVNFLLQRLESFEGLAVLTTNLEAAIDDAFKRRLSFRLTFERPDVAGRERLWRTLLPAAAPRADDIDWSLLAKHFELAGGHIRNAVVRAAYEAAADGGQITTYHLFRAAQEESAEIGMLVRDYDLERPAPRERVVEAPARDSGPLAPVPPAPKPRPVVRAPTPVEAHRRRTQKRPPPAGHSSDGSKPPLQCEQSNHGVPR